MATWHETGEITGLLVIDGTHSSGKSTLLEDYLGDRPLLTDEDTILDGTIPGKPYPYSCVGEEIEGITVPVVAVREIALQYAQFNFDRRVLTDEYTREDQAAISLLSGNRITMGGLLAAHLARKLQPERQYPLAAVISDRSPMSGFVYAETRLPGQNHDYVSISEMAEASHGMLLANPGEPPLALRYVAEEGCRAIDKVLIADPVGIDLDDNGYRQADLAFREEIHCRTQDAYHGLLGESKVTLVQGAPAERRDELLQNLRQVLGSLITA